MVKSPEHEARAERVMHFTLGWRKGATGAAYTEREMADPDFKLGHDESRRVKAIAHKQFCTNIGHNPLLDVFR